MKAKLAILFSSLILSTVSASAGTQDPNDDQIARAGEFRDDSFENRENRAGEMGDTEREQNLENRQDNVEDRQADRPYYDR